MKGASLRARTVGFGPHEVRGEVLHVGKLPSHLGGHLSRVASPPIVSADVRVGAVRNTAVFAKRTPSYFFEPRCLRVGVWRIVWGEDKTRFFPNCSPVRFEQKGVVAQMVERPLCMRKVGGSMPSYSKSYFCLFFSNWFPYETRVAFPEASDDAGLRPLSRKITRFPVFSLLFWPLVSSPRPIRNRRRPIRTVVPIVRSRIPGATRHHLRVTNDRVERRRRSLAGPHSAPARHAAVSGPSETARPGTPSSTSPEATHARERHRQGPPHLNARRSEQLG